MLKRIILCIVFIHFLSVGNLFSQIRNFKENVSKRGTTAATFLEIGVGARALALGGAFTALADDPSTVYWNIAGIAKLKRSGVLFNHSEWIADTNFDYFAAAFQFGRFGAVALSITSLSMDEMEVTTVDAPDGTGQFFRAGDYAVSIGYAMRLTDRFSIGFNPKFIHQFIWEMSATGIAMDLGVHYDTPFKGVKLGFAMTNFGGDMRMNGDNNRVLFDFDPGSTGNNERVPANLETSNWALPLNFKIGLMYQALDTERHRAHILLDAQHPNNDYESLNVGMEYIYKKLFSLRGGYRSLFLQDAEESFTLGAGLNYQVVGNVMIRIDYAYMDFGFLNNVQKFSLGIDF